MSKGACRFTQRLSWRELVELYRLTQPALNLEPRYNVAPTTQVLTIREEAGRREALTMRWGLVPGWWKEAKAPPNTFNARSDRIVTAPMYRASFKARRCIVPMSGFFEWKTEAASKGGKPVKRPFHITMASGGPMSVAGIWDRWSSTGGDVLSCSIVTTDANATMELIHNRMPVILGRDEADAWLSGRAGAEILRSCPADWLATSEVSSYVNSVRNQGERCIEALTS